VEFIAGAFSIGFAVGAGYVVFLIEKRVSVNEAQRILRNAQARAAAKAAYRQEVSQ
jgi:hypothetical protein